MLGLFKRILISFFLVSGLWVGSFSYFLWQIPQTTTESDMPSADAIIALTGDVGRLDYGVRLLLDGKGKDLFVSGVSDNFTVADLQKQLSPQTSERLAKANNPSIELGNIARNTIGNAEETKAWILAHNVHSILLVTSNYHMPRSLQEFHVLLPDITIIPAPLGNDNVVSVNWLKNSSDEKALLVYEFHKYMASKLRHWFLSVTSAP